MDDPLSPEAARHASAHRPDRARERLRAIGAALIVSLASLGAVPSAAQGLSPDAVERRAVALEARAERLDELFGELRRTGQASEARVLEGRIWSEWMRSGSATVDLMMAWAARAAQSGDHGVAFDYLDQIILIVPDYAEAWNRRATLHFIRGDYDRSIEDIEETLQREPRHFGALLGLGQIMMRRGDLERAREAFEETLAVYPANRAAQDALLEVDKETTGQPL